jgi:hypothetical protein
MQLFVTLASSLSRGVPGDLAAALPCIGWSGVVAAGTWRGAAVGIDFVCVLDTPPLAAAVLFSTVNACCVACCGIERGDGPFGLNREVFGAASTFDCVLGATMPIMGI